MARRFPEETVLIAYHKEGVPAVTAVGNNAFQSVIALKKTDPACQAIAKTGEFTIAYPGQDMEEQVAEVFARKGTPQAGTVVPGLKISQGGRIGSPILDQCLVNYQCTVTRKVDVGDSTIFLGRTVYVKRGGAKAARLFIAGYQDGRPVFQPFAGATGVPAARGREKYPEQTVMIVSASAQGRPNAMTAGWTMRVSDSPPMIAVAIGRERHTHGLIRQSKQFVYVYPGADMAREVLYCGTRSGRNVDKFQALNLQTQPAVKVAPPLPAKCLAAFECTVTAEIDYMEHTIFVGRIEAAHVSDKQAPRLFNLGPDFTGRTTLKGLELTPIPPAPTSQPSSP